MHQTLLLLPPPYLAGRPVQNDPPVPVHRLARARGAKNRRGLHRFHRTSAQNQGTVRTGWTNHCTLQVERKRRRTSIPKSNLSVAVERTAPAPQLVFFFFFLIQLLSFSLDFFKLAFISVPHAKCSKRSRLCRRSSLYFRVSSTFFFFSPSKVSPVW